MYATHVRYVINVLSRLIDHGWWVGWWGGWTIRWVGDRLLGCYLDVGDYLMIEPSKTMEWRWKDEISCQCKRITREKTIFEGCLHNTKTSENQQLSILVFHVFFTCRNAATHSDWANAGMISSNLQGPQILGCDDDIVVMLAQSVERQALNLMVEIINDMVRAPRSE